MVCGSRLVACDFRLAAYGSSRIAAAVAGIAAVADTTTGRGLITALNYVSIQPGSVVLGK